MARHVNLTKAITSFGVDLLISKGLVAQTRRDALLGY